MREGQGHGTYREVTDEQQAVVWLPTPSVCFHITSINHSGKRAAERDGEGENRHVNVPSVDTVPRYVTLIALQHMRGAVRSEPLNKTNHC